MSLYGTGRAEGIATAVALAVITMVVHLLGALLHPDDFASVLDARGEAALAAALAAATCYRFLRAQGRSRYAAALGGAAYALSPVTLALGALPREAWAAATAPLLLEVAWRIGRPGERGRFAPWLGAAAALPLACAPGIGALAVVLATLQTVRAVHRCHRETRPDLLRILALALVTAPMLLAPLWLPAVHGGNPPFPLPGAAAGAPVAVDPDRPWQLPGAMLLFCMLLGALRRQRHASTAVWLLVVAGSTALGWQAHTSPGTAPLPFAVAMWPAIVATTVLGTAGLDDFLDLPLRRRHALVVAVLATAAALAVAVQRSWLAATDLPFAGALALLVLLFPLWRRLGILRFKNALAAVTLLVLAVPTVWTSARLPTNLAEPPPAAPLGEIGAARPRRPDTGRVEQIAAWLLLGGAASTLITALLGAKRGRRLRREPAS